LFRPPRPAGRQIAWPGRSRLVIGTTATILAVAAAMVLIDARSLAAVRRLPEWLVSVFERITDLGLGGVFLWPLGILLLTLAFLDSAVLPRFVHGTMAAIAVRAGFLFAAIAVPGIFVAILKRAIGRARPMVADSPWVYMPPIWQSGYASLPSGHATTAFAAAVAIGALWPRMRGVMWFYAGVIALSRVVISAHHPSDVIAGAVVGALGAILVRNWFAARRLGFTVGAQGDVCRLPGPSWRRIKAVARRLRSA
jgi:undecaprenyl-diphosphatase